MEEQLPTEEMDLLGKKHSLARMKKERKGTVPKRKKGERRLSLKVDFTGTASRSRASEVKAGSLSF